MRRGIPTSSTGGTLTPEETALREQSRRAASERQWDQAFLEFQKLLASVRGRRDGNAEKALMDEFARLQEMAGDSGAASRTRAYGRNRFR
jgi:hypothetical protein